MKNLKVQKKLIVAFGIILIMVLFILCAVFVSLSDISSDITEYHDRAFAGVELADELDLLINVAARDTLYAANDPNTASSVTKVTSAKETLQQMLTAIEELRLIYTGDAAVLDEMVTQVKSLSGILDANLDTLTGVDTVASFEFYEKEILPVREHVSELAGQISDYEKIFSDDIYASVKNTTTLTIAVVAGMSVFAVVTGVLLAIYITRMLRLGITDVHLAAIEMAKGNFDVSVNYESRDEIGQMGVAIEELAASSKAVITDLGILLDEISQGNFAVQSANPQLYIGIFGKLLESVKSLTSTLNGTMLHIDTAAEQVASGAGQVSSGAQALSQGATEQASSIEELSATINIIANMINTTSVDADNANDKTAIAGSQLAGANSKMEDLVTAMDEIKTSSSKIQEIIRTIEDIAFQTNILALNAAVEAARAGDAGKGFAVVADEVRNLAEKSAEAAQNTQFLISNTVQAISRGNSLVADMAQDMNTVSDSASEVAEINTKISLAAKEAANAITQVTTGIDQISTVVQNNSATSEQSAAASEELSGQALLLKNMIGEFNLQKNS